MVKMFAQFDELAQLHGVQKIDVIGDAYLAATNVIEDQVKYWSNSGQMVVKQCMVVKSDRTVVHIIL